VIEGLEVLKEMEKMGSIDGITSVRDNILI
jgi:hypothetical protein